MAYCKYPFKELRPRRRNSSLNWVVNLGVGFAKAVAKDIKAQQLAQERQQTASNVPHAAVEPVPVEGGVRRVALS